MLKVKTHWEVRFSAWTGGKGGPVVETAGPYDTEQAAHLEALRLALNDTKRLSFEVYQVETHEARARVVTHMSATRDLKIPPPVRHEDRDD